MHDIKLNLGQREVEIDGCLFNLTPKDTIWTLSDSVNFMESDGPAYFYTSSIRRYMDTVAKDIENLKIYWSASSLKWGKTTELRSKRYILDIIKTKSRRKIQMKTIKLIKQSLEDIEQLDYSTVFYTRGGIFYAGNIQKITKGIFSGNPLVHLDWLKDKNTIAIEKLDISKKGNDIYIIARD